MLNLPHIWTPRKTLWLPGMSFADPNPLGSLGVCIPKCCEEGVPCEECSDGYGPLEFLVDITGVSDSSVHCTLEQCDSINDTYVLPFYDITVTPPTLTGLGDCDISAASVRVYV